MFNIVIAASLFVLITMFIVYDQLVKIQHTKYFDQWVKDGKPRRFFSFSTDENSTKESLSGQIRFLVWCFFTDEWMKENEKAFKLSKSLKLLNFLLCGLFFVLLYVSAIQKKI